MKIVELKSIVSGVRILDNAEFNALGMATSVFHNEKVLSFLSDEKYIDSICNNPNITAICTTNEIYERNRTLSKFGLILSDNPKRTFYEIHNELCELEFYWEKFENSIASTAQISNLAYVDHNSVFIGENVIIEPNVVIHSGTIIGNNVIIRSGSQIGSHGFQFLNTGTEVISVKTGGKVYISDNVEIQHNCCVDRGVLGGNTILSKSVKLDNFVHIAHDDILGERTLVTAGVKLSGRVTIGTDCWLGVNSTVTNGITIGNNCKISLGAVVTRNVPNDSVVSGNFAIDHEKFIQFIKSIR